MSYIDARMPRAQFGQRGLAGGTPAPTFKSLSGASSRDNNNVKRTAAITLAALGVGAVGLYAMARSGVISEDTPQVFTTVEQCVQSGIHASGVCEAQWNEARRVHDKAAPAYDTLEACEGAHGPGQCVKPSDAVSPRRADKYIPAMGGYFFGKTAEGSFKGVPLYTLLADGPNNFHIAELKPETNQEPATRLGLTGMGDADKNVTSGTDADGRNGGSRTTILFIPGANAAASGAAANARSAMPPGGAAGVAPGGPSAAPAAAARGGFGTAAHVGGSGGG